MRRNILHVGPQYKNHRGGIGAVLATYSDNIEDFTFIASYDSNKSKFSNVFVFFSCIVSLVWRLLSCKEIEVLHLHSASRGSFFRKYILFLIGARLGKKKIVYHLHGGGFKNFYSKSPSLIKKMIRGLLEEADCVICLSNFWLDYLSSTFNCRKLYIVNNPVSPKTSLIDSMYTRDDNSLNLLFLGVINKNKGIFDLLEVMCREKENFNGRVRLTIGGGGDDEKLISYIQECQLENSVNFLGWISGREKEAALSACDVLVLPSYNEGLPMSILEAMSCGKTILATSVGGVPEIVSDNENGFLFEPGNKDMMASLIKKLMTEKDCVKIMGKSSLTKVEPYLTSAVINQLNLIYKSVI